MPPSRQRRQFKNACENSVILTMGKPAARATIPDFFVAGLEGAPARAFARQGLRLNRDINYSSCRKSCAGIAKRCACSQQAQPFFWNSLPSREARATLWNEAQQKLASGVRAEAILGVARAPPKTPPSPNLSCCVHIPDRTKDFASPNKDCLPSSSRARVSCFGNSAPGTD